MKKITMTEWSLLLFSFFSMLAVSMQVDSLFRGSYPGTLFFVLIAAAGVISLFHLGKPLRAVRSIFNVRHSPVSREILFFVIFFVLSLASAMFRSAESAGAASVAGLLFLGLIDSVYARSDRKTLLHAGQTFPGGLLLISYFTGSMHAFTFMALLLIALSARQLLKPEYRKRHGGVRFLHASVILSVWSGLVTGHAADPLITILLFAAIFAGRMLFYADFEPVNIRRNIEKNINAQHYEAKRG